MTLSNWRTVALLAIALWLCGCSSAASSGQTIATVASDGKTIAIATANGHLAHGKNDVIGSVTEGAGKPADARAQSLRFSMPAMGSRQ